MAIVLVAGAVTSCGDHESTAPALRAAGPAPAEYADIHSVTVYQHADVAAYTETVRRRLAAVQATGFNTVWVVLPWAELNPEPLADPMVYNENGFRAVRELLQEVAARKMRVIIGLNYLGRGWSPAGIDACRWSADDRMYEAFESYVREFLRRIIDYSDRVYVLLFTETAALCSESSEGASMAATLRTRLGSLPQHLPRRLRMNFRIGFHDDRLVTLGWAGSQSPLAKPVGFDFVSTVAYRFDRMSATEIRDELETRIGRFRKLFPDTPLVIGELGASRCPPFDEVNQARVNRTIAAFALSRGLGLNVWHWEPTQREANCKTERVPNLALTRADGSLTLSAVALRRLFASVP